MGLGNGDRRVKMGDGDTGTPIDAIEELKRKGVKMGNVILVTEYGKVVELPASTLRTKKYKSLIKGKL